VSTNNLNETIKRVMDQESARRSDEGDVRKATAPYQKEFPYEREEEAQVTRREFCNFLGLTSSALFLGAAGFADHAVLEAGNAAIFVTSRIDGDGAPAHNSGLNIH
jgi:hypothetical protein